MTKIENAVKKILPEGAQAGEGINELVKLFSDMKIPDETAARMIECLSGEDAAEIDETAKSLLKHFKKPGNRD